MIFNIFRKNSSTDNNLKLIGIKRRQTFLDISDENNKTPLMNNPQKQNFKLNNEGDEVSEKK